MAAHDFEHDQSAREMNATEKVMPPARVEDHPRRFKRFQSIPLRGSPHCPNAALSNRA